MKKNQFRQKTPVNGSSRPFKVLFKRITGYGHLHKMSPGLFAWGFVSVILITACMGCASVKGVNESPTRIGVGAEMAPGIQLGNGGSSGHLLLGYSWIPFKGGGGHNNFFQGGLQYRYAFSKQAPGGVWAGAEATYLLINTNGSPKSTASGFTFGLLGGYRFLIGKVPMSAYLAPAFLSRGKFKTNGMVGGTGSSGFYGRAGIEFHLFSLLYKKGR
ncbi:MAG: hypothetical protein WAR78_07455 [Ferruginibacter sp.]